MGVLPRDRDRRAVCTPWSCGGSPTRPPPTPTPEPSHRAPDGRAGDRGVGFDPYGRARRAAAGEALPDRGAPRAFRGAARACRYQTRDRATGWVEERRVERSKMGAAVNVLIDAWNRDTSAAGGLLAGGLAFRLFLWLLPAALVAVSVLGIATDYSSESASEVARDSGLSAVVAATVAQGVQASQTGGLLVALFGTVFLLWASAGAARGLRVASSLLWQARPRAWNSTRAALAFLGLAIVSISDPDPRGPPVGRRHPDHGAGAAAHHRGARRDRVLGVLPPAARPASAVVVAGPGRRPRGGRCAAARARHDRVLRRQARPRGRPVRVAGRSHGDLRAGSS